MPKDTVALASVTTGPLPSSRKVYVEGERHPELRVAMREIDLSSPDERPLAIYDPSGPYTDPSAPIDIQRGLPALRDPWIRARGDVEDYEGRAR